MAGPQRTAGSADVFGIVTFLSVIPFVAASAGVLLAAAAVLRKQPSPATWFLFVGLLVLAADSVCTGLSLRAGSLQATVDWLGLGLVTKSFLAAPWLGFSLTYSRGDHREALSRWRLPLVVAALAPLVLVVPFRDELVQLVPTGVETTPVALQVRTAGTWLNASLLVAIVLVLMNLEQTFRGSVGTMRWRLKFVTLGLAVVFGAHLYARTQAILYSTLDPSLFGLESSALLVGCVLLLVAYARTGFAEADVYPSRAVVRSSVTLLIVGGYLFVVGVLAQLVRRLGGSDSFQLQALVVFAGMAGLALLLLSDRLRQRIQAFVGRHFRLAQHDSVKIWSDVSQRLTNVKDEHALCSAASRLIAETFDVLAVTVFLFDEKERQAVVVSATAPRQGGEESSTALAGASSAAAAALGAVDRPFNLEDEKAAWAAAILQACPTTFPHGGPRWCVPLRTGGQVLGAMVLADRVNAAPYTNEERDVLQCIAGQMTSGLQALRLAGEVARSRELEAFRAVSAFFVHDLKNAAASLNLMLKNLPVHFDDPEFRADTLRGIGHTANRIDLMITRLSAVREQPEIRLADTDVNPLIDEALRGLGELASVEIVLDFGALPSIPADGEQLRSVITNLILNARDATAAQPSPGRITIRTEATDGRVVISVSDDGCGMTPAFVRESLFKPFQSTKPKGLGIGMFQARMIVERHGGSINVESEVGAGTTVRISLPTPAAP